MDIVLRNLHDMRVVYTHAHAHAHVWGGLSIYIDSYLSVIKKMTVAMRQMREMEHPMYETMEKARASSGESCWIVKCT